MTLGQSSATPSTTLCLALMSGLLPSWAGSPVYADGLTAGGAQVQSATETSTNNLAKLSLEELMAIEVDTVYGASKHEQNYYDPASADFTQDSIQQDGRQFRIKATYKF